MAPTEPVLKKPSEMGAQLSAAIGGLPDAAADAAEVVDVGFGRDAGDGHHAAAAKRSDQPETQFFEEIGWLRQKQQGKRDERGDAESLHSSAWYQN